MFRKEVHDFLDADEDVGPVADGGLSGLTQRERELLDSIARGLTNAEIAERLRISDKTVRNHISSIFSKLGVEHRGQAIVAARKAGLGHD